MDDIIKVVKQEVALDGQDGTSMDRLWSFVELAQNRSLRQQTYQQKEEENRSAPLSVDDAFKAYIWPYLVKCCDLTFKQGDVVVYDNQQPSSSSSSFLAQTLDEIIHQYPQLTAHASVAAINKELFGREEGNSKITNSERTMFILQLVSRARGKGITQVKLSRQGNIDPRSTFHFLKVIDKEGLVVRQTTFEDGHTTNLWTLRQFAQMPAESVANTTNTTMPTDNQNTDDPTANSNSGDNMNVLVRSQIRKRISDRLEQNSGSYMFVEDLMEEMGIDLCEPKQRKYFNQSVLHLKQLGCLEQNMLVARDHSISDKILQRLEGVGRQADDLSVEEKRVLSLLVSRRKTGLKDGYCFRRGLRFIKPYRENRKVRAIIGVPLQTTESGSLVENMNDGDDTDSDSDSDDEEGVDIEVLKERDELKYMLSNPLVQMGRLDNLPLSAQLLRLIAIAGPHGLVSRSLQYLTGTHDFKLIWRNLNRLEKTPIWAADGSMAGIYTNEQTRRENANQEQQRKMLVYSTDEHMGREHRKRYFVNPLAADLISSFSTEMAAEQLPLENLPMKTSTGEMVQVESAVRSLLGGEGSYMDVSEPRDGPSTAIPAIQTSAVESPASERPTPPAAADERANAYGCIEDIYEEANRRRAPLNNIIRERIILKMLEDEQAFECHLERIRMFDAAMREYILSNRDSPLVSPTLVNTITRCSTDKRTIMRIIRSLEASGKLQCQSMNSMIRASGSSNAKELFYDTTILIHRSVDPDGPVVNTIVDDRKSSFVVRSTKNAEFAPKKTSQVSIIRTERGQRRDQMNAEKRRRIVEASSGLVNTPKEGDDQMEEPPAKWRRLETRVEIIDTPDQGTRVPDQDAFWMGIHTRLHHLPPRNLILKNLHAYLVDNLPKQRDRADVFPNYTFHNPYLFRGLPLEMFLQITNGVGNFPGLEDYIQHGNLPGEPNVATSRPEDVEKRLATTVDQLPDTIVSLLFESLNRVRCRFQWYINCLFMLQLIYPMDKALDLANAPYPPNSTSVFKSAPKCKSRSMNMGYQLIGKTQILSQAGYKKANDPLVKLGEKGTDLTVDYIEGGREYDVLDNDDLSRYWIDLQTHAIGRKVSFERTNPLVSFKVRANWLINVSMTKAQTEALDKYLDESESKILPLGDTKKLESAAKFAGTTLEVAQRYYENKRGTAGYKRTALSERNRMERIALKKQQREEEERRQIAEETEKTEVGKKKRKAGNKRKDDVNRVWSIEDSQKLIAYITVVYNHKKKHHTMSMFSYGELLFPRRIVGQEVEALGRRLSSRWKSMRGLKYFVALKVKLEVLWPFVYRAAMVRGDLPVLEEYHTIDKHDVKIETDYLYEFVRSGRVEELMQTYGDDVRASKADEVIVEDLDVFGPLPDIEETCDPKQTRLLTVSSELLELEKAKKRRQRRNEITEAVEHEEELMEPDKQEEPKKTRTTKKGKAMKKQVPQYLPDTLRDKRHLYVMRRPPNLARSLQSLRHEFVEDAFAERIKHSNRTDRTAWDKSITTHSGWECMSDYSCPITTAIRFNGSNQSAEEADDGDGATTSSRGLIVAKAAEHIPYIDSLSTEYPFERELDGDRLINKLQELTLGACSMEVDQAPHAEETDDTNNSSNEGDPQQAYVEMAVLQTLLLNTILTPDNQFDKDVSRRLFSDKEASERAIKRLTRHSMVTKLPNMSVSVGLKKPNNGVRPLSVSALTEALDKMVVSFETTGMTRIDQASPAADDHHHTHTANLLVTEELRRVPGRGFALHDRFRKILLPTIPERFESSQLVSGGFGSELKHDTALSVAEFEQMCRWMAGGKLWLRPNYQREPGPSSGDSLLWMVNTQQTNDPQSLLGFTLNVVDGQITEESGGSLLNEQTICVPFPHLAMEAVSELVDEMGIMGASENELLSLIQILLANLNVGESFTLPPDVLGILTNVEQLRYLLQQLVKDHKLFEVGSSDRRLVSSDNFHKYWALQVDKHTLLKPYLGQSLSGSTNKVYELAVVSSLVSRIIENPGIPENVLMRRFYAPYISRRDIGWYLDLLVRLGIVVSEKIALDQQLVSTHYHMSKNSSEMLTKLANL